MTAQTILPANSVTGGYEVANSLRFNSESSDYLNRTCGGGSRTTWTWSGWIKRGTLGTDQSLFSTYVHAADEFKINIADTDRVSMRFYNNTEFQLEPNRVFRDVSAWYHLVFVADNTNGTEANRFRIYVNGVRETSFAAEDQPTANLNMSINDSNVQQIGRYRTSAYFDGYMAEVRFIDGQALTADSFGEFDSDSGIWKPKDVSGLTSGTNGFYLDFEDSSALGNDAVGSNNFTSNNLTAVDQSTDTCTNNFATLNPLQPPAHSASNAMTLREGNLQLHGSTDGGPKFAGASTIGVSSGKWYAEFKSTISSNVYGMVGVDSNPGELARNDKYPGFYANSYGYFKDGEKYTGNSGSSYGNAWTNNTIGIALDLDNNKLYFSKDGTFQNSGDPTSGATGTGAIAITAASSTTAGAYFFVLGDTSTSYINPFDCNFGSPMHSISSGNADGNGYGNFEYAVPSGYFALCTKNLAEHG